MSEERTPNRVHDKWIALVAWLALLAFGVVISVYGSTTAGMMGGLFDWMRAILAMAETLGRAGTSPTAITLSAVSLGLIVLAVVLLVVGWLQFIRLSKELFREQEMGAHMIYRPLIQTAGLVLLFFVLSIAVSLLTQPILSLLQNLLRK